MEMIDIVFDGPPGPESGRFVEVQAQDGRSVRAGEWIKRADGYWVLRIYADLQAQCEGAWVHREEPVKPVATKWQRVQCWMARHLVLVKHPMPKSGPYHADTGCVVCGWYPIWGG